MKRRGRIVGVAVIAALALASPASAEDDPASQSPFGGEPTPDLAPASSPDQRLGSISASEAVDIATENPTIGEELGELPHATARAFVRGGRWQIEYRAGD